ncbi:MAG: GPR endopeptidase, partial [Clostridia bacterium]|nr:GPR endopeptidase [Clostridia bacterium]
MIYSRTDLALETHESFTENAEQLQGVKVVDKSTKDAKITHVIIETDDAAQKMGKPVGNYITLQLPDLRYIDKKLYAKICKQVSDEIKVLIEDDVEKPILVVGLGNRAITSDSLGPEVVDRLIITRHLFSHAPEMLSANYASVCAIAPGVLGITGIETEEIVSAVCEKVKPCAVIVVDALAARSIDRITNTIQICDTGICPGAGVGNNRREISEKTLGVPVIAIGVPTVVDAATIAEDTLSLAFSDLAEKLPFDEILHSGKISKEILNFTTTPKEIDILIKKASEVVANGINFALHDNI